MGRAGSLSWRVREWCLRAVGEGGRGTVRRRMGCISVARSAGRRLHGYRDGGTSHGPVLFSYI